MVWGLSAGRELLNIDTKSGGGNHRQTDSKVLKHEMLELLEVMARSMMGPQELLFVRTRWRKVSLLSVEGQELCLPEQQQQKKPWRSQTKP